MGAHAKLGASNSKRWINCPGSVRLSASAPPQSSSSFAELGTAAHELAEMSLVERKHPREFKGRTIRLNSGNSFIVDDDMIEAVQVYYELILEESQGKELAIETRFDLSWLHPNMFGTNDASWSEPFGELRIYDYKHGAGVAVDAEENTQMVYYAIGAAYDADLDDFDDYEKVVMTIVQPRAVHPDGPIRRWEISMEELKDWAKKLKAAAIKTEAKDAPLSAGDHCRWCPASAYCPAQHKAVQDMAFEDFKDNSAMVEMLAIEDVKKVVMAKSMIKNFIEDCEKRLEREVIDQRKEVEGIKVVRKRGKRDWLDASQAERILGQSFKMNEIYSMKLKTPAQMEKAIGKEVVKDLIIKKEGDFTIAPVTDKRKAVDLSGANDFKKE